MLINMMAEVGGETPGMVLGLNIAARAGVDTDEIDRLLARVRHELDTWRVPV